MPRVRAFLQRHWFSIAIPVAIGGSFAQPDVFRTEGALRVELWKDKAVMCMFLCSGAAVPSARVFRTQMFQHGVARHVIIQGISLLALPLLTAIAAPRLCQWMHLPSACSNGLCFLACLPTTIGLNIALTRAAGGDVMTATFHSAVGNSFGPFLTPVTATVCAGVTPEVSPTEIVQRLFQLIVVPMALGIGLRRALPAVLSSHNAQARLGITQQLCLLVILSNVFSTSFAKHRSGGGGDVTVQQKQPPGEHSMDMHAYLRLACVAAMCYTTFFLASAALFSRMPTIMGSRAESIAAVYCATQKTAAMGLPMLDMLYRGSEDLDVMVSTLLLYHMYQIAFGGVVAPALLRRLL